MKILEEVVARRPDATSSEVTASYNRRVPRGLRVHRSSIVRALDRAGFVFKKNAIVRQNKTGRMSKQSGEGTGA
jgi:hypothetical protein